MKLSRILRRDPARPSLGERAAGLRASVARIAGRRPGQVTDQPQHASLTEGFAAEGQRVASLTGGAMPHDAGRGHPDDTGRTDAAGGRVPRREHDMGRHETFENAAPIADELLAGTILGRQAALDPIFAAIVAHVQARDAFEATVNAQDDEWVHEQGGDTSDEAMAPAREAYEAASEAEVAAWNALFETTSMTLPGVLALIRHTAKWGPERNGETGTIDLEDALDAVADGLAGVMQTRVPGEPIDWRSPPIGFMASPSHEPVGFAPVAHGLAVDLERLHGIALTEYARRVADGALGEEAERLRRELRLGVLERAVRGEDGYAVGPALGRGAAPDRDWQAFAAMHPGLVPYPAHAPKVLMALDSAIQGEAARLLDLAEAEIARRRPAYVGFHDPAVWPRVEQGLRREMRMDALAMAAMEASDEADGVLVSLEAEFLAADAVFCTATGAKHEAKCRYAEPPVPPALRVWSNDWIYTSIPRPRQVTYGEAEVAILRARPCTTQVIAGGGGELQPDGRRLQPDPVAQARADAIVAAWDEWQAQIREARATVDLDGLEATHNAAVMVRDAVLQRVREATARGLTGLAIKARIATNMLAETDPKASGLRYYDPDDTDGLLFDLLGDVLAATGGLPEAHRPPED